MTHGWTRREQTANGRAERAPTQRQAGGGAGAGAEDVTVEDPDVEVELGAWPTVLGHIRVMEQLDLPVTALRKDSLVP